MEATGVEATVTITNSMRSTVEVAGIFAASDTETANDLRGDVTDPQQIKAGESLAVTFTPTGDSNDFMVAIARPGGTGATPNYGRQDAVYDFTIDTSNSATVTAGSFSNADDEGDDAEMKPDEIAVLARGAGEQYEVVEDPTDPEFAYAVYYTVAPTRAVIIRAPEADYKGDNIVSSKGQEISPRRYGGSFRKVAQALMDKMKEAHPAVDAAPAADTE
jgi:hypothetical protein